MKQSSIVKTDADHLLELVKKRKKLSVEETAKILKMPAKNVQALVDFFVEEKVLGIEYKFTTPYIYLYKTEIKEDIKTLNFVENLPSKEEFYNKAKDDNIPYKYREELWNKYIKNHLNNTKGEFYKKARLKGISFDHIDILWKKYCDIYIL